MTESRLLAIDELSCLTSTISKELLDLAEQLNNCYSEKKSLESYLRCEKLLGDIELKQAELSNNLGKLLIEMEMFLMECGSWDMP